VETNGQSAALLRRDGKLEGVLTVTGGPALVSDPAAARRDRM
jgi:hypothetical protein